MEENKNWNWTDELVLRYVGAVMTSNHPYLYKLEDWKKFIQEKQKTVSKEEYEILKCLNSSGYKHDYANGTGISGKNCIENGCTIKSVRRLVDNEIFSVGDKITGNYFISKEDRYIQEFFIEDGKMMLKQDSGVSQLRHIEKVKEPIPLFTTEDGKEIFEGYKGDLWRVFTTPTSYEEWKPYNFGMPQYKGLGEKYFSTEDAAKEYIKMNKPCLSLNDLLDNWSDVGSGGKHFESAPMFQNFKKVAEKKIANT